MYLLRLYIFEDVFDNVESFLTEIVDESEQNPTSICQYLTDFITSCISNHFEINFGVPHVYNFLRSLGSNVGICLSDYVKLYIYTFIVDITPTGITIKDLNFNVVFSTNHLRYCNYLLAGIYDCLNI